MRATKTYVADTNILIKMADGDEALIDFVSARRVFASVMSEMELLSKSSFTSHQTEFIRGVLSRTGVIEMNPAIKQAAIKLRQKYKLKLPDAIIAATAQCIGADLFTADNDFNKVKEIHLFKL